MDIAVKKRLETIRRKKEAAALIGTPGITKPSGSVGSLKHTPKSSASPNRLPSLSGPAAPPAHHARKRSLAPEQLARLFDDEPASLPDPATYSKRELDSGVQPLSTAADHEVRDVGRSSPKRHSASRQAIPTPKSAPDSGNGQIADLEFEEDDMSMEDSGVGEVAMLDDEKEDGKGKDESATSIALAAPDRPYTSWRGRWLERNSTVNLS
jgi:hypothetical protein